MSQTNAGLDLNLLRVFLAIWDLRSLTAAGDSRLAGVQERLTVYAGDLFDFPAGDLAAAGRVLGIVTDRANALLAGAGR